ncbi:MAG: DUF4180 domain-containing protein [Bacteroidetes bacterium]|nr:DUF4180 domain-containing protein [Bacteroidota bacterium]
MFTVSEISGVKVAQIEGNTIAISSVEDSTDLIGNLYFQGIQKLMIHQRNMAPEFFDLSTGLAGEVLQKFSNYGIQLIITGDFENVKSKSLRDFIRESNRGTLVNFISES